MHAPLSLWHEFDSLVELAITEIFFTNHANLVGNEEGYIYF